MDQFFFYRGTCAERNSPASFSLDQNGIINISESLGTGQVREVLKMQKFKKVVEIIGSTRNRRKHCWMAWVLTARRQELRYTRPTILSFYLFLVIFLGFVFFLYILHFTCLKLSKWQCMWYFLIASVNSGLFTELSEEDKQLRKEKDVAGPLASSFLPPGWECIIWG